MMLARHLLQLSLRSKDYDSRIANSSFFMPMPLSGKASPAPALLSRPGSAAAFGSERSCYQSAAAIQQYSGIAPVTERSGKNQHWVHRRWGRPHFVHQSFFDTPISPSFTAPGPSSSSKTKSQKAKQHPTAVRALAFKWQRIMFVCWRDRVAYDETTYLNSLKRRGSPLAAKLELTHAQAA